MRRPHSILRFLQRDLLSERYAKINEARLAELKRDVLGISLPHHHESSVCPADCFERRSKLGIDIFVEAVRETLRSKMATIGGMSGMGRFLRVGNVMRP